MTGVFVTGTDTGVGKTLVSAWLVRGWQADYWKPIQCGTADGTDAETVRLLSGMRAERIHRSRREMRAPLSPHEAARLDGIRIDLSDFTLPDTVRPLVVEGAGGVLVPLNEHDLMVDLIARLGLPALVVARSGLGTLNHTLLTIEALRRRAIPVTGVVMVGPANPANRAAIEHHGQVAVVAELPMLEPVTPRTLATLPPPPCPPPPCPPGHRPT